MESNVFAVYNLGTNDLLLGEISVKVNDNQYHVVRFHRKGHNATLQVDDYNVQTNYPTGKYFKYRFRILKYIHLLVLHYLLMYGNNF